MEQSKDRLEILEKIKEYELKGMFDHDVENDPPTRPLKRGEVDYTYTKFFTKLWSNIANCCARKYFDGCIKKGDLVIKEIRGIENYLAVSGGAILTCNHFNPYDNYVVYKSIQKHLGKRSLYKIIREGNFTSFGGLYGFFFRHCNTLPLSSNYAILKDMMQGVDVLLKRGEKILIYPEQGMWWNYRKPRPLKSGAYRFAVRSDVPVIPCFITMQDSDRIGADGFPIQEHTIHFLPAIYPDKNLPSKDRGVDLAMKNFECWKQVYEEFYGIKLEYTLESEFSPIYR